MFIIKPILYCVSRWIFKDLVLQKSVMLMMPQLKDLPHIQASYPTTNNLIKPLLPQAYFPMAVAVPGKKRIKNILILVIFFYQS